MITIIHGDDVVSSRNYLIALKKESDNPIQLNKDGISYLNLLQSLKGRQLFEQPKNIFIENLLSGKKNISESEKMLDLIDKNSKELDIYFWEGSELTKTNLNLFPGAKIKHFKLPQNLFYFLDNIKLNSKENVINFHKTLEEMEADAIFFMIIRQFRLLIALAGNSDSIDELKRMTPWQRDKLKNQTRLFTINKLKNIYNNLLKIDLGIKVGEITNLTNAIDIFLLDL